MADAFLVNNHTMCERLRYLRDNDGLYAGAVFNTYDVRYESDIDISNVSCCSIRN